MQNTSESRIIEKQAIEALAERMNILPQHVRIDPCGDWSIHGKRGNIHIFGQHSGFLIFITASGARALNTALSRLTLFAKLTRHGDTEGLKKGGAW